MNNVKTPVMVLQELTVKQGMNTPEYNLVYAKQGSHENDFHYQVTVNHVEAVGTGRSKQIAKHDAAIKALDILKDMGIYKPGEDKDIVKVPRLEFSSAPDAAASSIINLNKVCLENKIPFPVFEERADVGPPHRKEFTYQCQISFIVTRATAGTKKQAKQLAAKDMLERIQGMLPQLTAEYETLNVPAIMKDEKAIEAYMEYKSATALTPKPNFSVRIDEYDSALRAAMKEKELSLSDVLSYFEKEKSEETLKELCDKLGYKYAIDELEKKPMVLCLAIDADMPFRVFACDNSYEVALQQVISNAFEYLLILLRE